MSNIKDTQSASRLYEPKSTTAQRALDRATMRVNRINSRIYSMGYSEAGGDAPWDPSPKDSGVDTTPLPLTGGGKSGVGSPHVKLTDNASAPQNAEQDFKAQIRVAASKRGTTTTINESPRNVITVPKMKGMQDAFDKADNEFTLSQLLEKNAHKDGTTASERARNKVLHKLEKQRAANMVKRTTDERFSPTESLRSKAEKTLERTDSNEFESRETNTVRRKIKIPRAEVMVPSPKEVMERHRSLKEERSLRNILSPASHDAPESSHHNSQLDVADAIATNKIAAGGSAKRPKKHGSMVPVVQQLYKDVDADDQLQMLHSNIYIGDDSQAELKGLTTKSHGPVFGGSEQYLIGAQSARNQKKALLRDYETGKEGLLKEESFTLPRIQRNMTLKAVEQGFESHFHKRQMSALHEIQKNITIEMRKFSKRHSHTISKVRLKTDRRSSGSMGKKSGGSTGAETKLVTDATTQGVTLPKIQSLQFQPAAKHFGTKSLSMIHSNSVSKRVLSAVNRKMSLQEQCMVNSQSRVLQMLQSPVTHKEEQANEAKKLKRRRKSNYERVCETLPESQVDWRRIVLEMDLIDKDKLAKEAAGLDEDVLANLKNRDPDALDTKEQIELVRKQLVLSELGYKIPKLPNGDPDAKAIFKIKISKKKPKPEDNYGTEFFSPLKSERADSSIMTNVRPVFPLTAQINLRDELQIPDKREFQSQVKKLLMERSPLSDFVDTQDTMISFLLKQAIVRERMQSTNQKIDEVYKQVKDQFCNEEILLRNFKKQLKQERSVKGRQWVRVKADNFENNWSQLVKKGIFTHDGVQISETGLRMDAEYLRRQEIINELEQKIDHSKKLLDSRNVTAAKGDSSKFSQGDSVKPKFSHAKVSKKLSASVGKGRGGSVHPVMRHTSLEVVSEVESEGRGTRLTGKSPASVAKPSALGEKKLSSPLKIAVTNAGQPLPSTKEQDLDGFSLRSSSEGDRLLKSQQSGASTGLRSVTRVHSSSQQLETIFFARPFAREVAGDDDELCEQLEVIEHAIQLYVKMGQSKRLDAEERAKKTFEQKMKTLRLEVNDPQYFSLNKIVEQVTSQRQSHLKEAGLKLAFDRKKQLLQEFSKILSERLQAKRIQMQNANELREWRAEKDAKKSNELREKVARFLIECRHRNDIHNYVIEQEAIDSDEEKNFFDQMGVEDLSEQAMRKDLTKAFLKKVQRHQNSIIRKQSEHEPHDGGAFNEYFLEADAFLDGVDGPNSIVGNKKEVGLVDRRKSMISEISRVMGVQEKEGAELIHHGDLKSLPRFHVALSLAITHMSIRMREVIDSDDQVEGLSRYLRHCFRNKVLPLPLLGGRGNRSRTLRELLMEDLTISPKQAYCLAENLPRFGPGAARKLRLTNNNLPDELLGMVIEAAAKLRQVETLEIAYNKVGPASADAIAKLIMTAPNFRSLYLNTTRTPRDSLSKITAALTKYAPRSLQSLSLLHVDFTSTDFVQHLPCLTNLALQPANCKDMPDQLKGILGSTNQHLTNLNLQGFYMHPSQGIELRTPDQSGLLPFIERHRRLVHVNLSNNALDFETLQKVCREIGISCCETLEALHLSYNDNVREKRVRKALLAALKLGEASADDGGDTSSQSSTGTELAKMLLDAAPKTHMQVEELFRRHKAVKLYGKEAEISSPGGSMVDIIPSVEQPSTPIDETNVHERSYEERQAYYSNVILIFNRERVTPQHTPIRDSPSKRKLRHHALTVEAVHHHTPGHRERHGFSKWRDVAKCRLCDE